MKVLISGSFWHGSLEESYARAFESLGWQVARFDWDQYARSHPLAKFAFADKIVRLAIADRVGKWLVTAVQDTKPDLVYIIKGKTIGAKILEAVKSAMGPKPIVNFNPDSPWDSANKSQRLLDTIPAYDTHFTWNSQLVSKFILAGAKAAHFLPFAYDRSLHFRLTESPNNPTFDAVFVGTYSPQRDAVLGSLGGLNIGIWGNDWKKSRNVPTSWIQSQAIYGEEAVRALSYGAVSINILRPQNAGSHNMRTFEIPATGQPMLTTRSEEQAQWFVEGEEIECYASPEEMREKILALKKDTVRTKQLGERGYERVKEETYEKRVRTMLDILDLNKR